MSPPGPKRSSPTEGRALKKLAAHCAGHPLAAALTGAHLRTHPDLSVPAYAKAVASAVAAADGTEIPGPVLGILGLPLRALSPGHLRLLQDLAAHAAPELGARELAEVSGDDPARVLNALDELASAHLVEEVAPGSFRVHALIRDSLLASAVSGIGAPQASA